MNDNPVISIYVATYNHERYIVKALDSIREQKTKYSYEVLVGEDVSTDNTRQLLKQYEKQHPGFMTVYYRDHNMHHEDPNNSKDLKMRCKGKYVIALEGDDYWIDPLKLQKQVDFLENHEEYLAVAHRCVVVDENSIITPDIGIQKACLNAGLDVLLIEKGQVVLEGYDYGFIGGASGKVGNRIIFNGDITLHSDYDKIRSFIEARNLEIVYFDQYPLTDIGSIIEEK